VALVVDNGVGCENGVGRQCESANEGREMHPGSIDLEIGLESR
jgi:hypothetical protein